MSLDVLTETVLPDVALALTQELTDVMMITVRMITARTDTRIIVLLPSEKNSSTRPTMPPRLGCLRRGRPLRSASRGFRRLWTLGLSTLAMLREERLPDVVDAAS